MRSKETCLSLAGDETMPPAHAAAHRKGAQVHVRPELARISRRRIRLSFCVFLSLAMAAVKALGNLNPHDSAQPLWHIRHCAAPFSPVHRRDALSYVILARSDSLPCIELPFIYDCRKLEARNGTLGPCSLRHRSS